MITTHIRWLLRNNLWHLVTCPQLAGIVEYHPCNVSPSPKITPHVFNKVKIMAPVEQWHCANGVCMKGILAYSRGSGVRWGSLRSNWSQCGIGNSFVTHLAMLGTHGFLCLIPTQAPPRHHRRRTVIELMGHHSSYTRCHLRHPDDITFFRIIIRIKARLAFETTHGEWWYRTMLHRSIFSKSLPNIILGWNRSYTWVQPTALLTGADPFRPQIW